MRITVGILATALFAQTAANPPWKHLSTTVGDLQVPNTGREQTSATVFDADGDGVNDFVITERTVAPGVLLYRHNARGGWTRLVIETAAMPVEAGAAAIDVDGDGDIDFVAAGDWRSNEIWWWENPSPVFDAKVPWKRHVIKNSGEKKHHDLIFGDFDGDGKPELVFWNQNAHGLFLAQSPADPRNAASWPFQAIYTYSTDSEPQFRGTPERFKGPHEHEGLAAADIDGDGKLDIIGGGRWFRHVEGARYRENLIDASYAFSRAAAGQLKKGGRPEVVLVIGDGKGPLLWYEWVNGTWVPHHLADVDSGHSLQVLDVDGDGNLDIFCGEMRLNGRDPDAKLRVFYGDGAGNFRQESIATGFGVHESKMADLDGNGTPDILGKPYDWQTPRLDIWLNPGPARRR